MRSTYSSHSASQCQIIDDILVKIYEQHQLLNSKEHPIEIEVKKDVKLIQNYDGTKTIDTDDELEIPLLHSAVYCQCWDFINCIWDEDIVKSPIIYNIGPIKNSLLDEIFLYLDPSPKKRELINKFIQTNIEFITPTFLINNLRSTQQQKTTTEFIDIYWEEVEKQQNLNFWVTYLVVLHTIDNSLIQNDSIPFLSLPSLVDNRNEYNENQFDIYDIDITPKRIPLTYDGCKCELAVKTMEILSNALNMPNPIYLMFTLLDTSSLITLLTVSIVNENSHIQSTLSQKRTRNPFFKSPNHISVNFIDLILDELEKRDDYEPSMNPDINLYFDNSNFLKGSTHHSFINKYHLRNHMDLVKDDLILKGKHDNYIAIALTLTMSLETIKKVGKLWKKKGWVKNVLMLDEEYNISLTSLILTDEQLYRPGKINHRPEVIMECCKFILSLSSNKTLLLKEQFELSTCYLARKLNYWDLQMHLPFYMDYLNSVEAVHDYELMLKDMCRFATEKEVKYHVASLEVMSMNLIISSLSNPNKSVAHILLDHFDKKDPDPEQYGLLYYYAMIYNRDDVIQIISKKSYIFNKETKLKIIYSSLSSLCTDDFVSELLREIRVNDIAKTFARSFPSKRWNAIISIFEKIPKEPLFKFLYRNDFIENIAVFGGVPILDYFFKLDERQTKRTLGKPIVFTIGQYFSQLKFLQKINEMCNRITPIQIKGHFQLLMDHHQKLLEEFEKTISPHTVLYNKKAYENRSTILYMESKKKIPVLFPSVLHTGFKGPCDIFSLFYSVEYGIEFCKNMNILIPEATLVTLVSQLCYAKRPLEDINVVSQRVNNKDLAIEIVYHFTHSCEDEDCVLLLLQSTMVTQEVMQYLVEPPEHDRHEFSPLLMISVTKGWSNVIRFILSFENANVKLTDPIGLTIMDYIQMFNPKDYSNPVLSQKYYDFEQIYSILYSAGVRHQNGDSIIAKARDRTFFDRPKQ
eukprot:CAMPEP_0117432080 /NCGR_PEP_ID=MMETSP0758-20121206/11606_1 /TAXON_ID=63605 /ORGANISM="Percolomonas cosmopolitus, Strain AE-1 (ATCC 50343)" /LENGTH=973 /DNA_ID=CAMNT_0005221715 /DNA_START=1152 /DNA_END=4073 /DNA_ORIENTATION=-